MRFRSGWKVEVARPNGANYADLVHGTDKYVVGIPDQPFVVKVSAAGHNFSLQPRIGLDSKVDGRSAGHYLILSAKRPSTTFHGFVNDVKGERRTSQFLFGAPQTGLNGPTAAPSQGKTGSLSILVNHVDRVRHRVSQQSRAVSLLAASTSQAIEGKKWFLQPSLTTKAGDVVSRRRSKLKEHKYTTVRRVAELTMQMETASVLVLRKILDAGNPAHQAIIKESQPQLGDQADIADCFIVSSPARATASSPRGTKRKVNSERHQPQSKAVKPEPQTSMTQASSSKEVIDLT